MAELASAGRPLSRRIGRYLLGGELAAGGMATVHIGRLEGELGFSRVVAIKQLHPQYASDPDFVSMLLDEGRLACRVRHAHVVPALDIVVHEGQVFLVMEYVPGESLSSLLRSAEARCAAVPVKVAVTLLTHVLEGLHAAHETRDETGRRLCVVHRDVSPHNVLVGEDGLARLLDFGIAKAVGRMQTTRSHELKGKLAYMAPEQLARAEVDARTDVFAASIVLWELLTGARLFAADDEVTTCARVATLAIPRAGELRPALPKALDDVLMRGLARDPNQRWSSAREMARALESLGLGGSPRDVSEWLSGLDTPALARGRRLIEESQPGRTAQLAVQPALTGSLAQLVQRAANAEAPTRKMVPAAESSGEVPPASTQPGEPSADAGSASPLLPAPRRRRALALAVPALAALAWLVLRVQASPPAPPVVHVEEARVLPVMPSAVEAPRTALATPELAPATPAKPELAPRAQSRAATRPGKAQKTRARRARAKVDECAEPFLLDESGVRIPKRQCLE